MSSLVVGEVLAHARVRTDAGAHATVQLSLAPNATVGDLRDLIASDLGQVCVLNPKPEGV